MKSLKTAHTQHHDTSRRHNYHTVVGAAPNIQELSPRVRQPRKLGVRGPAPNSYFFCGSVTSDKSEDSSIEGRASKIIPLPFLHTLLPTTRPHSYSFHRRYATQLTLSGGHKNTADTL